MVGLVTNRLGRIPKPGDKIQCDGVVITVREANPRYIERVLLEVTEPSQVGAVENPA